MRGRASEVRDLGDGRVLRTGGRPEREARLMELARSSGYPVPAVHEVLPDGLILERIEGPTMARALARRPWQSGAHMTTLVRLHHQLHRIRLDGACLLHLDLHPENVLMSPAGPVVIDWTNARAGAAEQDLALTWLIMRTSAGIPGRLLSAAFARRAGWDAIREGLPAAAEFRLADPAVTDAERARVRRMLSGR